VSSYTIKDWCDKHHFSRGKWYLMEQRGTGPRTMREGRSVRISEQADLDWQREREGAGEQRAKRAQKGAA
jgi:hypothetical protein